MSEEQAQEDRLTAKAVDLATRLVVVGLVVAWCFVLLRPFVAVILWGIILAIALYPIYLKLRGWFGGRGKLASVLLTLVGIIIIVGPVSVMATSFVTSIQGFIADLSAGTVKVPPPPPGVADWPVIGDVVSGTWASASSNLEAVLAKYAPQVTSVATVLLGLAADAGLTALQFILAFIIAGILMPNAGALGDGLTRFAERLTPNRGTEFVDLARNTVRNVARGVIGISALQTLLLGIGFIVAGIPLAGLLTLLCLILAIIQIGPGIIVIGTIVYAWADMSTLTAVLFTAYMIPAALVDNVLRPIVMSRGLPVPMVVIFLGVMGGTLAHGLIGLFIGPVILAFGYDLARAWVLTPDVVSENKKPEESS
ncbi:MAG: AI-2E family transporter [Kiloniellales bacterium]